MKKTIWGLKQGDGQAVNYFEGLFALGISHFKDLFKAQARTSISKIVKVSRLFPHFFEEEDRFSLMVEVSKNELLEVLYSFQKGKIPGPHGWTIEFYMGFYDFLGSDILKVVEESRENGHVHEPLNSTFIALIPKDDNSSFHDFQPISLCSYLYKIISKVINMRLKDILFRNISSEQFGFLTSRKIHEAIGVSEEGLHNMKIIKLNGGGYKN